MFSSKPDHKVKYKVAFAEKPQKKKKQFSKTKIWKSNSYTIRISLKGTALIKSLGVKFAVHLKVEKNLANTVLMFKSKK